MSAADNDSFADIGIDTQYLGDLHAVQSAFMHRVGGNPNRRSKAMTEQTEVRFRLIRDSDVPVSHDLDETYVFGLQDPRQEITPGERRADGKLIFDFSLRVKPGPDPS
jgi:hypothetical protein